MKSCNAEKEEEEENKKVQKKGTIINMSGEEMERKTGENTIMNARKETNLKQRQAKIKNEEL